jgi:hypothetical protein
MVIPATLRIRTIITDIAREESSMSRRAITGIMSGALTTGIIAPGGKLKANLKPI